MKIVVNNNCDYDKLLKKIWLYKSIFYRNTVFEVENKIKDKNVDYIVKALNIKKRKDRINYVYDTTCDLIDDYTKDMNICDFKDGKCFVQRRNNSTSIDGCCGPIKCKHVNGKGCSTKNISCKFFYCPSARKKAKVLGVRDIDLLKVLSLRQRILCLINVTSTREEILKDLYSYSFIYAILRIFFRDCKNKLIK